MMKHDLESAKLKVHQSKFLLEASPGESFAGGTLVDLKGHGVLTI